MTKRGICHLLCQNVKKYEAPDMTHDNCPKVLKYMACESLWAGLGDVKITVT